MKNNWVGRRPRFSLVGRAVFLGAGGAVGLWLLLAYRDSAHALLAAAAFSVTALLGGLWQSRVRAARRWGAAVDAYAEREISRTRAGNAPKRARAI